MRPMVLALLLCIAPVMAHAQTMRHVDWHAGVGCNGTQQDLLITLRDVIRYVTLFPSKGRIEQLPTTGTIYLQRAVVRVFFVSNGYPMPPAFGGNNLWFSIQRNATWELIAQAVPSYPTGVGFSDFTPPTPVALDLDEPMLYEIDCPAGWQVQFSHDVYFTEAR